MAFVRKILFTVLLLCTVWLSHELEPNNFNFPILKSVLSYKGSTSSSSASDSEQTPEQVLHSKHVEQTISSIMGKVNHSKYFKDTEEEFHSNNLRTRAREPSDLAEIQHMIKEEFNTVIVFHAEWCGHCKKFIPILDEVSRNPLLVNFNFYKINCSGENNTICEVFDIKKYPTIQTYVKGELLDFEPPREKQPFTETLLKVSDKSIVKIASLEELGFFNKYYGDISFVFYNRLNKNWNKANEDEKEVERLKKLNTEFSVCVEEISSNIGLTPYVYFGEAEISGYKQGKENIEGSADSSVNGIKTSLLEGSLRLDNNAINGVVITGNFIENSKTTMRDYIHFEFANNCDSMKNFVSSNQFPIMKQLSGSYIKRLQNSGQTMLILVTDSQEEQSNSVNSVSSVLALRENIVKQLHSKPNESFPGEELVLYGYLNYSDHNDRKIVEYFGLSAEDAPSVVVYDFFKRRYFNDKRIVQSVDEVSSIMKELHDKLNRNEITWSTGNLLQDFFGSFGIELTAASVLILIVLAVLFLISAMFICSGFLDTSGDDKNKVFQKQRRSGSESKESNENKSKIVDNEDSSVVGKKKKMD